MFYNLGKEIRNIKLLKLTVKKQKVTEKDTRRKTQQTWNLDLEEKFEEDRRSILTLAWWECSSDKTNSSSST